MKANLAAKQRAYKKGLRAEWVTRWWLRLQGYSILTKRLKSKVGEVDIIAKRGKMLVFIEVKARPMGETHREVVSYHQQKRIEQAAMLFLANHPEFATFSVRFDVMIFYTWYRFDYIKQAW